MKWIAHCRRCFPRDARGLTLTGGRDRCKTAERFGRRSAPFLAIDVRRHAYYLDCRNRRADFAAEAPCDVVSRWLSRPPLSYRPRMPGSSAVWTSTATAPRPRSASSTSAPATSWAWSMRPSISCRGAIPAAPASPPAPPPRRPSRRSSTTSRPTRSVAIPPPRSWSGTH
ncbi:MAG: hypothetical protein EXQ95_02025 [Alphaproteobacteria bacterium]|nr:hypothetical protein [Alphaproteobacteria bacterium]